jgi:hypothetical protein
MNDINTTDTSAATVTPAVVEAKTKKQFTINTTEGDKKAFEEFCKEHSGPSKADPSKPKFLSSHEGFAAIWEVATSRRFESVHVMDEDGNPVYDEDSQPVFEVIDHLEIVANRIIAKRDEVDIEKQMKDLEERLALLKKLNWPKKS